MPYIRTRPLGDDDVTIEVRQRVWWTFWLFTRAVPLSTVRSSLNKMDWEIIDLIEKLKKILSNRRALNETCTAEYEEAKANRYDRFGISEWIFLDDKTFKDKVKPYTDRPKEDWRTFFSIGTIRDYGLQNKPKPNDHGRAGPQGSRGHIPGESGGSAGVVLPEHQKHSFSLREDNPDVGVFVKSHIDDKQKSNAGGGDKKSQKALLKQNEPYDEGVHGARDAYERRIENLWRETYGSN